jgi:hypothetical protein
MRSPIASWYRGNNSSAFLRRLELSGLIPPESGELSGDEEALIRERLQKLGYL